MLINRSEVDAPPAWAGAGTASTEHSAVAAVDPGLLVVPAMFEIDVRLKTDLPMRVEYYVRVRDDDDRLLHNDADSLYHPRRAVPTACGDVNHGTIDTTTTRKADGSSVGDVLDVGGAPARAQVTSEPSAVVFPDPAKFAHGFYTEGEFGALWFNGRASSEIAPGFACCR